MEIIVIDGGSTDGSLDWLAAQKDVLTIVQHNRGEWQGRKIERRSWGYFMNLAFKIAHGKYICMISDDCLLIPNAIEKALVLFERELEAGVKLAALAFYWRETGKDIAFHVGNPFGTHFYLNHGFYLKDVLEQVDYIDEENYQFYWADMDLCFRFYEQGYLVKDSPESYVEHYPHANVGVRSGNEQIGLNDKKVFFERWQGAFGEKFVDRKLSIQKHQYYHDETFTAHIFMLAGVSINSIPLLDLVFAAHLKLRSVGGKILRKMGLL